MEAVKKGEKTKSDGKILRLGIRFDSDYTISCPSEDVCIKHRGRRSPREEISLVSVSQIMAIEKRWKKKAIRSRGGEKFPSGKRGSWERSSFFRPSSFAPLSLSLSPSPRLAGTSKMEENRTIKHFSWLRLCSLVGKGNLRCLKNVFDAFFFCELLAFPLRGATVEYFESKLNTPRQKLDSVRD